MLLPLLLSSVTSYFPSLQISVDDIEIDIDVIDPPTFWYVFQYLKDCKAAATGGEKKRAQADGAGAAVAAAPAKKLKH